MKNILLTVGLSVATFFGVLVFFEKNDRVEFQQTLPAVEIKAKSISKDTAEMTLPEVNIRAKRIKFTSAQLPEVVIIAKKQQKPSPALASASK